MKTTLELTKDEIAIAITDYVKNKHTMFEPDKISFDVSNTADDRFGGGARYELISATVTCKDKSKK